MDEKYNPNNLLLLNVLNIIVTKYIKEKKLNYIPEETTAERVKADDLPPSIALEGNEEEVKLEPEETIAERVKLNTQNKK